MDNQDLRRKLADLSLSQVEFAALVGVSIRTVVSWTGGSSIPGPVEAYLNLLLALPKPLQAQELARIAAMSKDATEGLYSFAFEGSAGHGNGFIVAQEGRLFGTDGEVSYDGVYEPAGDKLRLRLTCSVPAGIALVTGAPARPYDQTFDIALAASAKGESIAKVETPYGSVRVRVAWLRSLPARAA